MKLVEVSISPMDKLINEMITLMKKCNMASVKVIVPKLKIGYLKLKQNDRHTNR